MTRVLIIGAGRGVGLETVWQALEAGYSVRAMARSTQAIQSEHQKLEKVNADATIMSDVNSAVAGCDVVITTLGIAPTRKKVTLFSETATNVISAMRDHGVNRLIAVTGMGAGDSKGVGGLLYSKIVQPLILGPVYEDKEREEDLVRDSGLDWTIVRPGILTRLRKKARYKILVEPQSWKAGFITRADVADFLVKQISDRSMIGKTPMVIND